MMGKGLTRPRRRLFFASREVSAYWGCAQVDAEKASPFDQLTPCEREVMQLIAEGRTNNGIAQLLNVSTKTVEKHRANLMAKLDVHDVAGLTRIAIEHGLIFIEE
jgi:DNA-binding NarL/FixJ family response regulator